MKKSVWARFLSVLLVVCMMSGTASAAGISANRSNGYNFFWNWLFANNQSEESEESDETDETTTEMAVIEDEDTVENGDMLRASTYSLTTASEDDSSADTTADTETTTSTILKYFPVTMYDYDTDVINDATHEADIVANNSLTKWQGIYFSGGTPDSESYVSGTEKTVPTFDDGNAVIDDGSYFIVNRRSGQALIGATTGISGTTSWNNATVWNIAASDNGYTLMCTDGYMTINSGTGSTKVQDGSNTIQLVSFTSDSDEAAVMLYQDGQYLNQYGGASSSVYGGYNASGDMGSVFYLYKVTDSAILTGNLAYAEWNWWNKNSGNNDNGQKTYTGLVKSELDANKNIVFTKPEGGIFSSDTSVKSIYTNVKMPFVYKDGFYTFDASQNGVYFHEDEEQSSDGTAASNTRLYFNEGTPQTNGGSYGDGSSTVWAPYNDSTSFSESDMDYHFGLQATIPFTMTSNGRIVATNDESEAIKFSFSGDDDVWVFIDGQLVVDLGGIHNRLDVAIDFAENTVTYSESNSLEVETGSYNDADFELVQTLFGGLISKDRASFAAADSHELTIFYLERGEGSSNCKIEFNLPVNDSVTVTKDATQSWSEDAKEATPLTIAEQAIVDNIDFYFTLYRKTESTGDYAVVGNTTYYLLNSNGQVISSPATDDNGKFTLKNGQSARFITTEMDDEDGVSYYVIEDAVSGFTEPDYNYGGEAANGFINTDTNIEYATGSAIPELECTDGNMTSNKITVVGGKESEDSLIFICSNFLDAELPNPSARPVEDKIVIDYGLPVEIDVLANDVYRGNSIELVSVTGAGIKVDSEKGTITTEGEEPVYGTAEIQNGKIVYTLDKQLSGVEVLNYVVKVTGTATQEVTGSETIAYEYAVGTVYVIPATSMYYEENFADLVTFTGETWSTVGTAQTDYQEPGVVGTIGDSPYGSDVAYIKDSGDSNGSSKYVTTVNGAAQFTYKFTGWGTSFFARTTENTGYMRIVITDETGKTVYTSLRNTVYKKTEEILYNIPVFTYDADKYGTYTVTVTIAKGSTLYGSDFWLDGIRVLSPLNESDENVSIAKSAYATDAEANMAVVTLRNKLLADVTTYDENGNFVWAAKDMEDGNFVLFTDIDGAMTAATDYESFGPKEEVYLNNGQKVSFALYNWDADANKIYLGMKVPTGSGTVLINSNEIELLNAADCYYDITKYATITTDEDGIRTATFEIQSKEGSLVSVTNIKVTGSAEFVIVDNMPNIDVDGDEDENVEEEESTDADASSEEDQANTNENAIESESADSDENAIESESTDVDTAAAGSIDVTEE